MSIDDEGPSTPDGPSGADDGPFEVGDWQRFLRSPAAVALESGFDADAPDLQGVEPFVGRSRILGLLPGETKFVTFEGTLFEVSMEPALVDAPATDRSATAAPGDGAVR